METDYTDQENTFRFEPAEQARECSLGWSEAKHPEWGGTPGRRPIINRARVAGGGGSIARFAGSEGFSQRTWGSAPLWMLRLAPPQATFSRPLRRLSSEEHFLEGYSR
jgi:hypothetical protein